MSWDVYLRKVPESIVSLHEIYDNFKLLPLGDREDIIAVFKEWSRYREQVLESIDKEYSKES